MKCLSQFVTIVISEHKFIILSIPFVCSAASLWLCVWPSTSRASDVSMFRIGDMSMTSRVGIPKTSAVLSMASFSFAAASVCIS